MTFVVQWTCAATVTVGIWTLKAGVWTRATTIPIYLSKTVTGSGNYTMTWTKTFQSTLGTGIDAVGYTIESTTSGTATADDIVNVTWVSQTSASQRTATPNGALTTVTVRPK